MSFKLVDSTEYKQIRERRKLVNSLLGNTIPPPLPSVCSAVAAMVNQHLKPYSSQSGLTSGDDEKDVAVRIRNIYNTITKAETLDSKITVLTNKIMKNVYDVLAVSVFPFAECIFQFDCELPDVKKFRQGGAPTEDSKIKMSRISRRKAEDCYRNGQYDEAIRIFKEAEEKFDFDYTVSYQMGLLYFFERADYNEAMSYFRKACKYAQNKSKQFFIASMAMIGLMTRLYADATGESNLYSEAYQACSQAYNLDNGNNMALYALAQCSASMRGHSGHVMETNAFIRELIKRDRFFALQVINDRAFSRYIVEIEKFMTGIMSEVTNSAVDMFKGVDDSFEKISEVTKYISVPSKVSGLKSEYNAILANYNSNKVFFDIVDAIDNCKSIYNSLQELFQEVAKNRIYYEIRESLESMTKEYNAEAEESASPFKQLESEIKEAQKQFDDLSKNYPLSHPQGPDAQPQQDHDLAWYQTRGFVIINVTSGILTSVLFIGLIISTYVFLQIEITWLTYLFCIGILCFIPIYGRICGEMFYIYVEKRRNHLSDKLNRLERTLEARRPIFEENQQKIKDKYLRSIMEKHKVPAGLAEKMFDCGQKGNFEQLKLMLQSNPSYK